jgi:hypothetical protein
MSILSLHPLIAIRFGQDKFVNHVNENILNVREAILI